jgi:hypothetical protein
MKTMEEIKERRAALAENLSAVQHVDSTQLSIIDNNLALLQNHVNSALKYDRAELEKKVATITAATDKLFSAVTSIPLPTPVEAIGLIPVVGSAGTAIKKKMIGDMLGEMMEGMNDAEEGMDVARIGVMRTFHTERMGIAKRAKDVSAEYMLALDRWQTPPKDEVKNYMELRELENKYSQIKKELDQFDTKVSAVLVGTEKP